MRPTVPVLLGGDQGFFWMYGTRMLHGELPYRDFFQLTLPGADLAHVAAFAVFGPHVAVASALIVALGTALALACFVVARGVVPDRSAALATALFVTLVFGQSLTTTHHSFSMLFTMLAVAAAGDGDRPRRLAGAGALLGLATFCTQTHGVAALVALTAFSARVAWRDAPTDGRAGAAAHAAAIVVAGFALALAVPCAPFVVTAGASAVWASVGAFVAHHMERTFPTLSALLPEALTARSFPALAPFMLVDVLVAGAYLVALPECLGFFWRGRDAGEAPRARAVLLAMVGVALLAEVSVSLSWVRLFAVVWPGLVLFVADLGALPARAARVARGGAWASVAVVALLLVRSTQRHHPMQVALPGGVVAADPTLGAELAWLTRRVPPGGKARLFAANRPSVYLPLGLANPLYLDAALPGAPTTVAHAERAIRELDEARVAVVLWVDVLDRAMESDPGAGGDGLRALSTYLHARYRPVATFANGDEAWERAPD